MNLYLDIFHQIEVLDLVKKLNEEYKMTIVMVLHDINQAIKYSDNIVIMKNGKIIEEGTPKSVINEKSIKTVYNVEGIICNVDKEEMYFVASFIEENMYLEGMEDYIDHLNYIYYKKLLEILNNVSP